MEEASQILGFTPTALWIFFGVAIALGIIAKLVMDLIIKTRELRKPKLSEEKEARSAKDRLSALESTTRRQDDELTLILRSQMAMIHHMVDGNNTAALRQAQKDIEDFLITGKIKT